MTNTTLKKADLFYKNQTLIIRGAVIIPEDTQATVTEIPAPKDSLVSIEYKSATGKSIIRSTVNKKFCYLPPFLSDDPSDFLAKNKKLSDKQKYMMDLLNVRGHNKTVELALEGVDIDDYDVYTGKYTGNDARHNNIPMWTVLIPKDSDGFMPMVMAHTDIHPGITGSTEDTLRFDDKIQKFYSPGGLGADDRAGLYAINQLLRAKPKSVMVGFFNLEEVGCVGSREFVDSALFTKTVSKKASTFISIDRRRNTDGTKSIATYNANNKELFDIVKQHTGRTDVRGSSTDCKVLSLKSGTLNKNKQIACFNMSCGYQYEHTNTEVLYFEELEETVSDMIALVSKGKELWDKQFIAKYITTTTTTNYRRNGTTNFSNSILVDKVRYYEADVEMLLAYYKQHSGSATFNRHMVKLPTFSAMDTVQLKPYIGPQQVVGGIRLSVYMHRMLIENQWVVRSVNPSGTKMDLVSEDGMFRADNMPTAAFDKIEITDPAIYLLEE